MFAERAGVMRGVLTGIGGGLMWFIIYSSYALAFWYGVKLIMDDRVECFSNLQECNVRYARPQQTSFHCIPQFLITKNLCCCRYTPSSLLIVFFSVLMAAMNVGQASPYVEAFAISRAAAASIFAVIDRIPPIDSMT